MRLAHRWNLQPEEVINLQLQDTMAEHLDRLRCPFCLEEVQFLEKPKQLKCNHITCLPCLKGHDKVDPSGKRSFICPICSKEHEVDTLDSLPDAQISDESPDGEPYAKRVKLNNLVINSAEPADAVDQSEHRCTACKQEVVLSVCYCINCDKKLCSHHERSHNEIFDGADKHKFISMQKFCEKPDLYVKPLCKEHNEFLAMCCKNCYTIKCPSCPTENDCQDTSSEGNTHVFKTLKDTETQIKSKFSDAIKQLSTEVAELCVEEKQAWLKLDDIEEDCRAMTIQVEKKAKELTALVKSLELNFKERIACFEQTAKVKAEIDMEKLRGTREELETKMASCEKFLRDSHVTKIVENSSSMLSSLRYYREYVVGFPKMEYLKDDVEKFENLNYALSVDGVQFISESVIDLDNDWYAHSLAMTSDGIIICCCHNGLLLQTPDMKGWIKVYSTEKNIMITGISLYGDDLYIIETNEDTSKSAHVVLCVQNFLEAVSKGRLNKNMIFQFEYACFAPMYRHPDISVSAEICLVTFGDSVACYNMETGNKTFTKDNGVRRCADPNIMSTGNYWISQNGRYLVNLAGESLQVDRATKNKYIDGICRWKDGMLVLSKPFRGPATLRILGSSGKHLASFSHEMLDYCSDDEGGICSNQDNFAVFGAEHESVLRFKLVFGKHSMLETE